MLNFWHFCRLLCAGMPQGVLQKVSFCGVKGGILERERCPFTMRKNTFCKHGSVVPWGKLPLAVFLFGFWHRPRARQGASALVFIFQQFLLGGEVFDGHLGR